MHERSSTINEASCRPLVLMEEKMKRAVLLLATMFLMVPAFAAQQVSYPAGFHDWQHVKSMVINKGHPLFDLVGGVHHIYANPKAMKGYKSGEFPNGAVIVFDLFEAKEADNAILEGAHKAVIVMEKGSKSFAQKPADGALRCLLQRPKKEHWMRRPPRTASPAIPSKRTRTLSSASSVSKPGPANSIDNRGREQPRAVMEPPFASYAPFADPTPPLPKSGKALRNAVVGPEGAVRKRRKTGGV
jgi:Cytochrome P460